MWLDLSSLLAFLPCLSKQSVKPCSAPLYSMCTCFLPIHLLPCVFSPAPAHSCLSLPHLSASCFHCSPLIPHLPLQPGCIPVLCHSPSYSSPHRVNNPSALHSAFSNHFRPLLVCTSHSIHIPHITDHFFTVRSSPSPPLPSSPLSWPLSSLTLSLPRTASVTHTPPSSSLALFAHIFPPLQWCTSCAPPKST